MLNAFLLLLLAAGQLELLVTFVNRLHGYRIRGPALRWVRDFHELLIVVLPLGIAWLVGRHGAMLLAWGSWSQLPTGWLIYFSICGLGALGLVYSAIRYALRSVPASQVSNHTNVVDVAAELGFKPLGSGPYRAMARFPLNEIFQ